MQLPTISVFLLASFSCVTSSVTGSNHPVLAMPKSTTMEGNNSFLRKRLLQGMKYNSSSVDDTPDIDSFDNTTDTDSFDDTPDIDSFDNNTDIDSFDNTTDIDSFDDTPDIDSFDNNTDINSLDDTPGIDSLDPNPSADDISDSASSDGTSASTSSTQSGSTVLQREQVSSSFRPFFMQATAFAAAALVILI